MYLEKHGSTSTDASLPDRSRSLSSPITNANELTAAWLLSHSDATRRAYASDLRHWRAWLDRFDIEVLDAHRAHVDAYRTALDGVGASPATVARRLAALSGFYTYATDEGLIERSPVARVRRPKVSDASPRLGLDREELGCF
jgi:integrase/recombinase XerD